eukprot:scaffold271_cov336-Pavlova_lutheri.AAC.28
MRTCFNVRSRSCRQEEPSFGASTYARSTARHASKYSRFSAVSAAPGPARSHEAHHVPARTSQRRPAGVQPRLFSAIARGMRIASIPFAIVDPRPTLTLLFLSIPSGFRFEPTLPSDTIPFRKGEESGIDLHGTP